MSMIWRSAMPLLTTLAALVIIVHCIEEDLETEYRHDLRPRILDTGSLSNFEPWRHLENTPLLQQSRNTENWNKNAPDDTPKRRRPGRKRKRRPQATDEDIELQERYVFPDEPPRPYHDVDYENNRQTTTEVPTKEWKIQENRPIRWTDDDVMALERPMRTRGRGRRKRPSLENWPTLSEFGVPTEKSDIDDQLNPLFHNEHRTNKKSQRAPLVEPDGYPSKNFAEDKSLSEFSLEIISNLRATKPSMAKDHESEEHIRETENKEQPPHEQYAMDPVTLKEILKKSNGSSLSEILQQHNLSLSDLLSGKEQAVSVLKSQDSFEDQHRHDEHEQDFTKDIQYTPNRKEESDEQTDSQKLVTSDSKYLTTTQDVLAVKHLETELQPTTTVKPVSENPHKASRLRYPATFHKKLRMRPMINVTNPLKGQLNRDLIALNARKYSNHRRNTNKSREWKEIVGSMKSNDSHEEISTTATYETTTMSIIPDETTISIETETTDVPLLLHSIISYDNLDDINMDVIDSTAVTKSTASTDMLIEIAKNITEKPAIMPIVRPVGISSGLRREAFNNRLKRKRLKQKNLMTEPPTDEVLKSLLGMGNLVSSSEFIARTQEPRTTKEDDSYLTTSNDFVTTKVAIKHDEPGHLNIITLPHTTPKSTTQGITEDAAKIEIDEILHDKKTSSKLSIILQERNMTLNELLEHRERGSSHVHLADIFHNASKEPNPPEPFLSKSLIEPISKETYPLRAILEANSHDTSGKGTTIEPTVTNTNIPTVMNYRSNVNENAENMGIMTLFNNFTKNEHEQGTNLNKLKMKNERSHSTERKVKALAIAQNITTTNDTVHEIQIKSSDDTVSWNEIFSLMGRSSNETEDFLSDQLIKKPFLDGDSDSDGFILLEDLQHLVDFDNNMAFTPSDSKEKNDMHLLEQEPNKYKGILDKIPSQTKSVTIATACIAGLAMILFLMTYAVFKWKQQNNICNKGNYGDQNITTPVFENRKGLKSNSSSRSMSPMLPNPNLYSLNTIDSLNSKQTPDYMWESLRKPFQ